MKSLLLPQKCVAFCRQHLGVLGVFSGLLLGAFGLYQTYGLPLDLVSTASIRDLPFMKSVSREAVIPETTRTSSLQNSTTSSVGLTALQREIKSLEYKAEQLLSNYQKGKKTPREARAYQSEKKEIALAIDSLESQIEGLKSQTTSSSAVDRTPVEYSPTETVFETTSSAPSYIDDLRDTYTTSSSTESLYSSASELEAEKPIYYLPSNTEVEEQTESPVYYLPSNDTTTSSQAPVKPSPTRPSTTGSDREGFEDDFFRDREDQQTSVEYPYFIVSQLGKKYVNEEKFELINNNAVKVYVDLGDVKSSAKFTHSFSSSLKNVTLVEGNCKLKDRKFYCTDSALAYTAQVEGGVGKYSSFETKAKYKKSTAGFFSFFSWKYWTQQAKATVVKGDIVVPTGDSVVRASMHDIYSLSKVDPRRGFAPFTIALDNNYSGAVRVRNLSIGVDSNTALSFMAQLRRDSIIYSDYKSYSVQANKVETLNIPVDIELESGEVKYVSLYTRDFQIVGDEISENVSFGVLAGQAENIQTRKAFPVKELPLWGNRYNWDYDDVIIGEGKVIASLQDVLSETHFKDNQEYKIFSLALDNNYEGDVVVEDLKLAIHNSENVSFDMIIKDRNGSIYYLGEGAGYSSGYIHHTTKNVNVPLESEQVRYLDFILYNFNSYQNGPESGEIKISVDSGVVRNKLTKEVSNILGLPEWGNIHHWGNGDVPTDSPIYISSLPSALESGVLSVAVGTNIEFFSGTFDSSIKVEEFIFNSELMTCNDGGDISTVKCTMNKTGVSDVRFIGSSESGGRVESDSIRVAAKVPTFVDPISTDPVSTNGILNLQEGDIVTFKYTAPEGVEIIDGDFVGINESSIFDCSRAPRVRRVSYTSRYKTCSVVQKGFAEVYFEGRLDNGDVIQTNPTNVTVGDSSSPLLILTSSPESIDGALTLKLGDTVTFTREVKNIPEGAQWRFAAKNSVLECVEQVLGGDIISCTAIGSGEANAIFSYRLVDGTDIFSNGVIVSVTEEGTGSTPSTLTVGRTDNITDGTTLVAGIDDLKVLGFRLENSNDGDIHVTGIETQVDVGSSSANAANLTGAVFVSGIQQGSAKNFNSGSGLASFNDLSLIIPSSGSAEVELVVDTTESLVDVSQHTSTSGQRLQFSVVNVESKNINTGGSVEVKNLPLNGASFLVIKSGLLYVEFEDFDEDSQVLVSGQEDVEVFRMRLIALDDNVEVKDIYIQNISSSERVGERLEFTLRDQAGQLLQARTMVGDKLHFELSNSSRIFVPKDESVSVSVFADVRSINAANQTGKQLQLEIDTDSGVNGFEAITVATGRDLESQALNPSKEKVTAQKFTAYRTKLSFATANTQPSLYEGAPRNELYRFVVTPDSAGSATLDRVSLDFSLSSDLSFDGPLSGDNFSIIRCDSATKCENDSFVDSVIIVGQSGNSFANVQFTFDRSENINGPTYYQVDLENVLSDRGNEDFDFVSATFKLDNQYQVPEASRDTAVRGNAKTLWSDRSNGGSAGAFINGYLLDFPDTANSRGATR